MNVERLRWKVTVSREDGARPRVIDTIPVVGYHPVAAARHAAFQWARDSDGRCVVRGTQRAVVHIEDPDGTDVGWYLVNEDAYGALRAREVPATKAAG